VPDWSELVGKLSRQHGARLPHEVVKELAAHLEDSMEKMRLEGLAEAEAITSVLDSVDWRRLDRAIRRSRDGWRSINDRTMRLWIPAMSALLAATLLPMIFLRAGSAWFAAAGPAGVSLAWLALQPLIGALGAHLSRRGGGLRSDRLLAGLFPSMVMLALGLLLVPVMLFMEKNAWASAHLLRALLSGVGWSAAATAGLLAGTLPFLGIKGLEARRATPGAARW